MNDTFDTLELSSSARDRQQAMLPGLLTAVEHRRRRRLTVRTVGAAILLTAIGVAVNELVGPRGAQLPQRDGPAVVVSTWTSFSDDPSVAERCVVANVSRAEWFIDDDEVNKLLAEAGRPTGIIRAGGRVSVNPAAFDPWPESEGE